MPGSAWDLLPMDRYRAHNWHCLGDLERQPYAAIYTTLGCPYHCSFCCIQAPFKAGEQVAGIKDTVNSYRYWSPARVVEESISSSTATASATSRSRTRCSS